MHVASAFNSLCSFETQLQRVSHMLSRGGCLFAYEAHARTHSLTALIKDALEHEAWRSAVCGPHLEKLVTDEQSESASA